MIPLTTLYDEYIDRPKLTEQKNSFEFIVPTHLKRGRHNDKIDVLPLLLFRIKMSLFHCCPRTLNKILDDEVLSLLSTKNRKCRNVAKCSFGNLMNVASNFYVSFDWFKHFFKL